MDETKGIVDEFVKKGFSILLEDDPIVGGMKIRLRRGNINSEHIVDYDTISQVKDLPITPFLTKLARRIESMEHAIDMKPVTHNVLEPLRPIRDKLIPKTEIR